MTSSAAVADGTRRPLHVESRFEILVDAVRVRVVEQQVKLRDAGASDERLALVPMEEAEAAAIAEIQQMVPQELVELSAAIMRRHPYGLLELTQRTSSTELSTWERSFSERGEYWKFKLLYPMVQAIAIELCWTEHFPADMLVVTAQSNRILTPRTIRR